MRGVYTAYIKISSLAAAKTLMLIQVPSTRSLEIISCGYTNSTNSTGEQLLVGLYRVNTIGSPSGTSVTPVKHEEGDSSSGCTVTGNLTVEPTSYVTGPIDEQGISNLAGYRYDPLPEERPIMNPSTSFGLRMISTPSTHDAIVQVVYREIG